jgi:hypothetical protein
MANCPPATDHCTLVAAPVFDATAGIALDAMQRIVCLEVRLHIAQALNRKLLAELDEVLSLARRSHERF